ncbi:MAG: hypothetical protein DWQ34_24560 [Planctomycetota bacterium]|nr:MAG: hypothetical protein DWQ34_24560 [Planctomycetota bacterium]
MAWPAKREASSDRRTCLLTPRTAIASLLFLGACAVLVLTIGTPLSLLVLAVFVCLLLGILVVLNVRLLESIPPMQRQPELLQILLDLASDRELASAHQSIAEDLQRTAQQQDPVFRRLALRRLQALCDQCTLLGEGTVDFTSTESWRVVYEELLRSPGLHLYRSVAYIESAHYWQDGPGQQSTQLNFELHDAGVIRIERIAIVADHLWPADALFPVDPLHSWLDQHHRHGIGLKLVRESGLEGDTDLLSDFGIYGYRAVGIQVADPAGRTIRFVLSFDFDRVQQAEVQWSRLSVYATPYQNMLDQQH